MQPDQATNNGGRTMELVAAAPRCQLLLIVLMAAMLLPGMKVSPLLIWRKIARTIELQENIGKEQLQSSRHLYYDPPVEVITNSMRLLYPYPLISEYIPYLSF
ncbi:hypothetical protein STEG23_011161 [Scotinomys teguina]